MHASGKIRHISTIALPDYESAEQVMSLAYIILSLPLGFETISSPSLQLRWRQD